MKPNAICFFDMDGTLLNSEAELLPSSMEALEKLRENNIVPIIATGRTLIEIDKNMAKTKIDSAVAMNGQLAFYKGEVVYQDKLEPELIARLTAEAKSQNVEVCFYNGERIGATAQNETVKKHFDYLGEPMPGVYPDMFAKETINMALLLLETGDEYFPSRFPELQFVRNTPFSNDVLRKGGSKARGIEKLIEVMGYEGIPTYAFGDGKNDMEMFQDVDYAVAMENAMPGLKEHASYITDTNNNDGIAKALAHYKLI